MSSLFFARPLKRVATIGLAALILPALGFGVVSPSAYATDGAEPTVSVRTSDDFTQRPIEGRPAFNGLLCVPGRQVYKVSYSARVPLDEFWKNWEQAYASKKEFAAKRADFGGDLSFTLSPELTIRSDRLSSESLRQAFARDNAAIADLFHYFTVSVVGQKVNLSFSTSTDVTAEKFDSLKNSLRALTIAIPDEVVVLPASKVRTDDPVVGGSLNLALKVFVNAHPGAVGDKFGFDLDLKQSKLPAIERSSDPILEAEFVSGTAGKELPAELIKKAPGLKNFASEAAIVDAPEPLEKTFVSTDGTWTFAGWSPKKDEQDGCAHFSTQGKWIFSPAPKEDDPKDDQDQGKPKDDQDQGKPKDDQDQGKPKPQPQDKDKGSSADHGQSSAKPQAKDANKSSQKAPSTKGGLAKTGFESGLLAAAGLVLVAGASLVIVPRRNS